MAALPPAPGVAKVIIKQAYGNVNVFNILHVAGPIAASWTAGGLQGLATSIRAAWVTNVLPLQASQLTLTDVQCVDLSSEVGEEGVATGSNTGGIATAGLPANVAVCWSWKIARRYRGGHPRTYIAGVHSSQANGPNTLLTGAQTSHLAAANAMRTAINAIPVIGSTARLVCVHYRRNKVILPAPLISDVLGASVDNRLDSQRRRLGRDRQ